MDSLIFELQIVFYFQLFLSANVRHREAWALLNILGLQPRNKTANGDMLLVKTVPCRRNCMKKRLEGNTFVLVNQHDVTDCKPGMHNVLKTLYLYDIGRFYAKDVKVVLRRL